MKYPKKLPVGTKIKYLPVSTVSLCEAAKQDIGKTGKVVGYYSYGIVRITLKDSEMQKQSYGNDIRVSVRNVQPFRVKGEQLLFSFMNE